MNRHSPGGLMRRFLCALLVCWIGAFASGASPAEWMPRADDTTQIWWENGPPRMFGDVPPPASSVLCFQFGRETLRFDTKQVRPLEGSWECSLTANNQTFRCTGHSAPKDPWLQPVRFVESGRFFQRVLIEGLKFTNAQGQEWDGAARLEITTWPDRWSFRLESDSDATFTLEWNGRRATGQHSVLLEKGESASHAVVESELTATWDEALGCHRLALPEKPWSNAGGTYYPAEHLDRVDRWRVELRNETDEPTVARLMFTQERDLPITGFTPMLCEPDGTPTGLLVQLSKNWHQNQEKGRLLHEGPWFHGFAWVRIPPKASRSLAFQMVYARYGGVFAASHAQLSLIGWGHNQFWDQAAIGSFGESICFEPGRVQRRCFITDVRPLTTLPHKRSEKAWGWAENCGGGDFLMWKNAEGLYQPQKNTRIEYRSHGPCLTDVSYYEETAGGEISARMDVSVPRTNDCLRAFFRLDYEVHKPMRWERLAFFQLGADFYNDTPARKAAIGDVRGLQEEWQPQRARDEYDRRGVLLQGAQPWISMHGLDPAEGDRGPAIATRGLIVRSWKAVLGGRPAEPYASFFCTEWGKDNHRTVAELTPPPDISELRPGDHVQG